MIDMSGYVVVHPFADSRDAGYVYRTGDAYPRDGVEADSLRIAELASTANSLGFPLIEEAHEKAKEKAEKPVTRKSGNKTKKSDA